MCHAGRPGNGADRNGVCAVTVQYFKRTEQKFFPEFAVVI